MERTPPSSCKATHSSSDSNINILKDTEFNPAFVPNTQRQKRQRTDEDRSDNEFTIFQETIMSMLTNWKAEQNQTLIKLVDDSSEVNARTTKIQESNREIEKSLEFLSKKYDDIERKISDYEQRRKDDRALIKSLEKHCTTLQSKLDTINQDLNSKEQWARSKNIEIKGVPQNDKENLLDLVCMIGERVNFPITKSQLDFVTRVQSRDPNQTKSIIACFNNKYIKEDFIAAARLSNKQSPLIPSVLGLKGTQKIYVNDHLTGANKDLLSKAKKIAKEKGFQFVWV